MKEVVDDIYKLFESNTVPSDEWADELGKNVGLMIKERMAERQDSNKLRMSSLGRGNRYLWYSVRDTPKETLSPSTRIKFLYGDVIELIYIALIKLAGHEVTREQEEVELNGIVGHIDCAVDGELVDIKSASSFSFNKFRDETLYKNDAFGYYAQLSAYSEATGLPPAGWLVMDKALGHLCFSKANEAFLPNMFERTMEVKEKVAQACEPAPCHYPVPDGKSGNMKLAVGCSYCQFKKHCWREANEGKGYRTFMYSSGPRFLTNVAILPKVPEITNDYREDDN